MSKLKKELIKKTEETIKKHIHWRDDRIFMEFLMKQIEITMEFYANHKVEDERNRTIELIEKTIQEERFSGSPYALNKVINFINNNP